MVGGGREPGLPRAHHSISRALKPWSGVGGSFKLRDTGNTKADKCPGEAVRGPGPLALEAIGTDGQAVGDTGGKP